MGFGLVTHQDLQVPVLAGLRGTEESVTAQEPWQLFMSPHPCRGLKSPWMWHLGTMVGQWQCCDRVDLMISEAFSSLKHSVSL